MLIQLGIAAIPCALFGDWNVFIITTIGSLLVLVTGLLPQWGQEKWACRRNSNDTYVLTRGNGAQHAIVILGNGHGLNLEDLAAGQTNMDSSANLLTRVVIFILSVLWVLLLITAAGLKSNTWFLLAVGGLGILQNIVVAGSAMVPEHFGVYLQLVKVIGRPKVMDTLLDVEKEHSGLGRSMLGEFFPGGLRAEEEAKWTLPEQTAATKPLEPTVTQ
jgi:hypothetical protein